MTQKTENTFHTVTVRQDIPELEVRYLLSGAFDGGSNYWAKDADPHLADGLTIADFQRDGSEATLALQKVGVYFPTIQNVPFVEGCSVTFTNVEGTEFEGKLDRESMTRALDLMASKHPRHFDNFLHGDMDCETGDVFLQLALFGDIIYG